MSDDTPAPTPAPPSATPVRRKLEAFYDPTTKNYLVQDTHGGWIAVTERSLGKRLAMTGLSSRKDGLILSEIDQHILAIQDTRSIVYAGPLAGYDPGITLQDGNPCLVTKGPTYVTPKEGDWSMLKAIYDRVLTTDGIDQTLYYHGFMHLGERALRTKSFIPAPALVLAGPVQSCKTLISKLSKVVLGGRSASPYRYMLDKSNFNKDLFGAECLIVDDEVSAIDYRAREIFGCQIKNMLFAESQSAHGKGKDAFSLRPFWRLFILLNDSGWHLRILPPLEASINDKIMILRTTVCDMPMDTSTPELKAIFWNKLLEQVPAYVWHLQNEFVIPPELKDPRTGIMAFKHPTIQMAIREQMVEFQLLKLIDDSIFDHPTILEWSGSANDLWKVLKDRNQTNEAAKFLSTTPSRLGVWLSNLQDMLPGRISYRRTTNERIWRLTPPSEPTAMTDMTPNSTSIEI